MSAVQNKQMKKTVLGTGILSYDCNWFTEN